MRERACTLYTHEREREGYIPLLSHSDGRGNACFGLATAKRLARYRARDMQCNARSLRNVYASERFAYAENLIGPFARLEVIIYGVSGMY